MKNFFLIFFLKFIFIFDKLCRKIGLLSFLQHLVDNIIKKTYYEFEINKIKNIFFVPSNLSLIRVHTIFSKEPDTIQWIKNFKSTNNEQIIFWDIGANVGIYSIFAARTHSNIKVISFEPSTSNLRCLSRNISINNLEKKIFLCQIPLTNVENSFLEMKEKIFSEGGATSTFGENFDYTGKQITSLESKYHLFGTSINFFLRNNILELPDYIKLDVDGIEHMILDGANQFLSNKKIKGISVELNKNFESQFSKSFDLLINNGFAHNPELIPQEFHQKGIEIMNYHFERKNI